MTNTLEQPSNDPWIKKVKFKGNDDVYEFSLLPADQCAQIFSHFLALATPILTGGYQKYGDYITQLQEVEKLKEEGHEGIDVDLELVDLAFLFSKQIREPEFLVILKGLVVDLKKNGQPTTLDREFRGEFDKYLKLLELAFKENLMLPLGRYLEEKGLSGMLTCLQVLVTGNKEAGKE